jgi:hypothetical protein
MTLLELLWFVPLMLAISVVLGITGARGRAFVLRETRRRFIGLTVMVVVVGVLIRVLVTLFA